VLSSSAVISHSRTEGRRNFKFKFVFQSTCCITNTCTEVSIPFVGHGHRHGNKGQGHEINISVAKGRGLILAGSKRHKGMSSLAMDLAVYAKFFFFFCTQYFFSPRRHYMASSLDPTLVSRTPDRSRRRSNCTKTSTILTRSAASMVDHSKLPGIPTPPGRL